MSTTNHTKRQEKGKENRSQRIYAVQPHISADLYFILSILFIPVKIFSRDAKWQTIASKIISITKIS